MTRQSTCWCAYIDHSSRTFSFELYGEKVDPKLSQNHGTEKQEDHHVCLNSNGLLFGPCNNRSRRTISFELFGEKIVPNLTNQSNEQQKEDHHHRYRFLNGNIGSSLWRSNSMVDLDACNNELDFMDCGYLSDGVLSGSNRYIHDKNKGLPWTRDEHKSFLMGLEKLGKGKWREISTKYVQSRTPTQVASHAQKYFIRIKERQKGKRRSSLFDMTNESIRYGNYSNKHISRNPFNNSWTQRTSQALSISQPLAIIDGSPQGGVASSTCKEKVSSTK